MKKAIEIKLHISETSLRVHTNYKEKKIILFEKEELGNAEQVFRKMDKVLEGIRELIEGDQDGEIEYIIEGITAETRKEIMRLIVSEK